MSRDATFRVVEKGKTRESGVGRSRVRWCRGRKEL